MSSPSSPLIRLAPPPTKSSDDECYEHFPKGLAHDLGYPPERSGLLAAPVRDWVKAGEFLEARRALVAQILQCSFETRCVCAGRELTRGPHTLGMSSSGGRNFTLLMCSYPRFEVPRMAHVMAIVGIEHVDKVFSARDSSVALVLLASQVLRFMPIPHSFPYPVHRLGKGDRREASQQRQGIASRPLAFQRVYSPPQVDGNLRLHFPPSRQGGLQLSHPPLQLSYALLLSG